jgi:hypothetical protein
MLFMDVDQYNAKVSDCFQVADSVQKMAGVYELSVASKGHQVMIGLWATSTSGRTMLPSFPHLIPNESWDSHCFCFFFFFLFFCFLLLLFLLLLVFFFFLRRIPR